MVKKPGLVMRAMNSSLPRVSASRRWNSALPMPSVIAAARMIVPPRRTMLSAATMPLIDW